MKKINLNSKLSLNKKTVSQLNSPELNNVIGGAADGGDGADEAAFLSIGRRCTNNYGCSCNITRGLFCHKHMA